MGRLYLALFVLALAVRAAFFLELHDQPVFSLLMIDSQKYDLWARTLASGKWLGSSIFYQAPLYPYFLGVFYTLFGPSALLVRSANALLSALSCVLLCAAGRRFFGKPVGMVAGAILAIYPTSLFFDSQLQKSSLDLFLTCLLLYLLSLFSRQRPYLLLAGTGLVLGCLILTRENAFSLVPVAMAYAYFTSPLPGFRSGLIRLSLLAAGLTAVLLPVGLRNYAVGGEFHLTTSQMGPNFFIGNRPGADGLYSPLIAGRSEVFFESRDATDLAEREAGRRLSPGEVSQFWMGKALGAIESDPLAWLRLMIRKALLLLNRVEIPDTYDQYSYADWSRLLRVVTPLLHFGTLLPLAAAGIWMTRSRRRELWVLYVVLAMYAFSVILFYVFSRYRFPLVPVGLLFAAAGIVGFARGLAARRWRQLAVPASLVVAAALLANWPMLDDRVEKFQSLMHGNVGLALANQGRFEAARTALERALYWDATNAMAQLNMGSLLRKIGRDRDALAYLQRAVSLEPAVPEDHLELGRCLSGLGRSAEAIAAYRETINLDPLNAWAWYWTAQESEKMGNHAEAQHAFSEARRLNPGFR